MNFFIMFNLEPVDITLVDGTVHITSVIYIYINYYMSRYCSTLFTDRPSECSLNLLAKYLIISVPKYHLSVERTRYKLE